MKTQKRELSGGDPGRKKFKKRAFLSTDGSQSSKAARTGVSSNTRRLEDIPVSRRQVDEDEDVLTENIARARDVKDAGALPFV